MIAIQPNTPMLLFRFKSYKNHDFITSHINVCNQKGSVWLMKAGKKTSVNKINHVKENGGWIILRSPKREGSKHFLAHFSEFTEKVPESNNYPSYYQEILADEDDEVFSMYNQYQWFNLTMIHPLLEIYVSDVVLSNTKKPINEVIEATRTAIMIVENRITINVKEESDELL